MAEKEEQHEEGAKTEAKPKGKKKLIIIIAALLIVGGGAGFFLLGGKKEVEKHAEEQHEEERHLATAQLDPFIVNLSESSSFLKVTLLIEYDVGLISKADPHSEGGGGGGGEHGSGGEDKAGGLPPIMEERKPMIRDAVIRVLASKKSAEVLSVDGKESLKQELVEAINEALGLDEGPIVAVYYTEFIIQ